jgi:hypothetical protein
MALGTNYARSPTPKQMDDMDRRFARHDIRKGLTREEFLAQYKEQYRERLGVIYDEEKTKLTKKAEREARKAAKSKE